MITFKPYVQTIFLWLISSTMCTAFTGKLIKKAILAPDVFGVITAIFFSIITIIVCYIFIQLLKKFFES